jgi:hypothetical protein
MCRAAAAISNKDFEILTGTMVYLSKRPNYSHDRENTGRRTAVMELSALQRPWNFVGNCHVSCATDSYINPLTPELNPSAQRCLAIFFTGDFAS